MMRVLSSIVCEVLGWLTVLGLLPLLVQFWLCSFSAVCVLPNFFWAMAFPGVIRTSGILVLFGPFIALVAWLLALRRCDRGADVLDTWTRRRHQLPANSCARRR
jgi:hypothetical protein